MAKTIAGKILSFSPVNEIAKGFQRRSDKKRQQEEADRNAAYAPMESLFNDIYKQGQDLYSQAEEERQDFQIPDEIKKAYSYAQQLLGGKSTLQSGMEENASRALSGNLANINKGATSATQAILAGSGAQNQYNANLNQAAMAGAQQKSQREGQALGAAQMMGDYDTMKFDQNINIPYLQKLQFSQDMIGSGLQGKLDMHSIGRAEIQGNKDRRVAKMNAWMNLFGNAARAGATAATGMPT